MFDGRLTEQDTLNTLNNIVSEDISLERYPQQAFFRKYSTWRRGFAPNHMVDSSEHKFQLPDNSALHIITDFLNPESEDIVNPNLNIPFIQHETWRKFYGIYCTIPSANDPLFPITDVHTFQSGRAYAAQVQYYNKHPGIKRISSDDVVGKQKQALIIYDYGPLHRVKLPGIFSHYRMTELILRSILRHICDYPYRKNHFVYIPLSDKYYSRSKFIPAFRQLNNSTVKFKDDPSYDVLIHLLGFVYGIEHPLHSVRYSPNDVKAINKFGLVIENNSSTSIFNRLDDNTLSVINIILDHRGEMVIYNLKQLKDFASKGTFFLQFYRHVMKLKSKSLSEKELHEIETASDSDEIVEDDKPEAIVPEELVEDEIVQTDDDEETIEDDKNPLKESTINILKPLSSHKSNFADKVEASVLDTIEKDDEDTIPDEPKEIVISPDDSLEEASGISTELGITDYIASLDRPAQKRAQKLLAHLPNIKLNGISLKEHIESAPRALVKEELAGGNLNLIDPETKSSPIFSFDQQYLKGNLHSDLARTVTSFMKQGFFVADISEQKDVTRIDSTTTYKVKYVSVHDGKSHLVSFTLPNVDKEGVFKDNGNEYRLIKQKTAVPIAKVSPTRVGLFSSYNKSTVERTSTRNSFSQYILKILDSLVRDGKVKPQYGHLTIDHTLLPLEYTAIASRYSTLVIGGYHFTFNYPDRFDGVEESKIDGLKLLEVTYGVYTGYADKNRLLFYSVDNGITILNREDDSYTRTNIVTLLKDTFKDYSFNKLPYEFTLVTIISQSYSLIFLLGLIHGLMPVLRHIKARVRFVPKGKSVKLADNELRINFKNGSLVYNRYPLLQSFIISGLSWCNPSSYNIEDFEVEDTYFDILMNKGISVNQIKGIRSFFELFMDPITKRVLELMHEPTNISDLLIRATEMLTTESHYPASSERNYRFRSFERFPSIVYTEIARAISSYESDRTRGKTLSVHPKAVYQKIYGDPAKTLIDTINPIHEIKDVTKGSYAGIGGRTGRSFVVRDRTFSPDSVGVISEATPDSGKVGMIFSTVMDPNVIDLYGRTIPHEEGEEITSASKMMSVVGNLLPGLAQDD